MGLGPDKGTTIATKANNSRVLINLALIAHPLFGTSLALRAIVYHNLGRPAT